MEKLFYNGKIRVMDEAGTIAEAVGVDGGKIVFVGSNEEAEKLDAVKRVNLKGKTVLPGFNETHMHMAMYAFAYANVRMFDCRSVEDCLNAIKGKLQESPATTWIYGRGWNEQDFTSGEKRYPTKKELDTVSDKIPIMVVRADGHISVVNSPAMKKILQVPRAKEIPHCIHEETGELNESAVKLFYEVIDEPPIEYVEGVLEYGLKKLAQSGITTTQSDDLMSVPAVGWRKVIEAFKNIEKQGRMDARVYEQCLFLKLDEFQKFVDEGFRTGQGGDFFKIGPLKLLLDGSLGARTAALTKPYVGTEDNYGILVFTQEEMDALVELAMKNKIQIAVHCIGNRAMEVTLNSFERAQKLYPNPDARNGIVHAQLTTNDLLKRMAEDKCVAYVQPVFQPTDMKITASRVGDEWEKETYAWKTMEDLGILVAGGSDAPVESFNVIENIYFAVTRKDLNGYPEGGWLPDQKLTVDQAVRLFTTRGAQTMFMEDCLGQLKEGFIADMVVLDKDIYEVPEDEIKDVKVCMTILGGRTTYKA